MEVILMADTTKIPLVSSEISGIWNSYIGETLLACIFKCFSNRVDDDETRVILQNTLDSSNQRIHVLTNLFHAEKLPIPAVFTDNDINIDAPRLYTDSFYLQYVAYASKIAMHNYSITLSRIARSDLRDYFSKCIFESVDLYNKTAELSLSKGIFIRSPHVEVPKEVQYIKNESFMLNWFQKKRPSLADEITQISSNINDTIIRRAIVTGFYQVCKDKKISDHLSNALTVSAQHISGLASLLTDENIPIPATSDSYVTDSTISPFSDKLILNKLLLMYRIKVSCMGMAMADINRSDLKTIFMKYLDESTKNAENTAAILIDRGWLEQPPQAINHENLVEV
jgi:hypothetical protein